MWLSDQGYSSKFKVKCTARMEILFKVFPGESLSVLSRQFKKNIMFIAMQGIALSIVKCIIKKIFYYSPAPQLNGKLLV